jgi:phosphoserine phosphatase RsbU/P
MIEQLFQNAPCGYFAFNDHGTTVVVNDTLAFILERSKTDIIGKSVETFFTLPTRIFFQTHFFPTLKMQGHAEEIFITLLTAKGTHLPVLLNAKKLEWEEQIITCCSCILVPNRKKFEDDLIAARKTAEKALQENTDLVKAKSELQQQTEQLDRQIQLVRKQNHELQQFNHVVTHNLKEPIRKIEMYTGMIADETVSSSVSKLVRANEQMKAVVSGLQQYVWLNDKTNEYTLVDLNVLVEETIRQLQQQFAQVQLSIQHNTLPTIEGDKEQLTLMLHHLLSNAVKYRKGEAASVTIDGTLIKQNRFRSVENKYQYQDFVRIEIIDKGIGFDPMHANHIFDLFRKLHFSEGQGLGLALCRKIVENHGGQIKAESELNKFTKLTVWLPYFQSPAVQ